MEASSPAETTSYAFTRTGTFSFKQSDAIMELGVGIFTPSFCNTYGFYLVARSAGRKARGKKPGQPKGSQNQSKASRK